MSFNWLEICGIVFLFLLILFLVQSIWKLLYVYLIGPTVNKVDFKSMGRWALVTGSTDGIGKEYAKQLAARGCDIILVSRSMDKLRMTADEIEKSYKVNTKIIQVDFNGGDEVYDTIAKEITDLEIGTIVNNIGVYPTPNFYMDIVDREKVIQSTLKLIVISVTRMTALVLPGMLKRQKGVIINIASGSAVMPPPMTVIYAASKAFTHKFTQGIEMEYGNKGIIVQSVLPGVVCTKMSGVSRETWKEPSPERFVKSALSLVGTAKSTAGYFPHAFLFFVVNKLYAIAPQYTLRLIIREQVESRQS